MAGQNILRKLNAAKAGAPVSGAGGVLRALSMGPLAAYSIPGFAEQKAQNRADTIEMFKGPLNELQYIGGQLLQGRLPYTGPSQRAQQNPLLGRVSAPGTDSGWWRGTTPPSPAAERDYQQKVSRVAQLTAQDPELQRYEEARQKAKLAGPGSAAEQSAEDLGMQIWAKKYGKPGDLASRVKPGQAGYDVIQRTLGAGQMGSPLNLPFDTSSPLGTTPPISPASYDAGKVAQGLGLSTVPRNAFAGASAAPYAGFSQGPTLQSAPLGFPSEMPTASYAGATGIQPMGSAVDKFDPKGLEAQRLLEMFKDSIFTTQK
jgi:hypothetical protein